MSESGMFYGAMCVFDVDAPSAPFVSYLMSTMVAAVVGDVITPVAHQASANSPPMSLFVTRYGWRRG